MKLSRLTAIANTYFATILVLSCFAGFFVPDAGGMVVYIIPVLLASIVFSSFFQISFSGGALIRNVKKSLVYSAVRFIALPSAAYFVLLPFSHFYAQAMFLLFLAPAAVSAPAFTGIYGGNTGLSAVTAVVSNSLAIITIPLCAGWLIQSGSAPVDSGRMFRTLVLTILLPFFLHFPFRRIPKIKDAMIRTSSLITIACLSVLVIAAVSRYKMEILDNRSLMMVYAAAAFAGFMFLYAAGYFLSFPASVSDRISYCVCSGANNIGLAITLAILYFPSEIKVFFIIAQIVWTAALIPAKYFFRRIRRREKLRKLS
ncbi:MAG: bile acid:sodium symporter family protein [Spirochaetota bacterium]